ncbi:MAG: DNA mismatch repair endonuclease MutL [Holosporales bacterium]|jgi:DNA mismatch repair protein MutL|nr:DNA mismatch repair endonuclease MutL [Holosporales bacterium]
MIRILPSDIVNQIAAGEVVERPASIVKELVENAIDAGGTKIEIVVRDGGRSYICVKDNGSGMTASDLDLCILRHATSKLTAHNLLEVNSFGFRGEALPSICSISRVEIKTKHAEEKISWMLSVDGGNIVRKEPTAHACGTTIYVRDLFFNTPVRLKFLKSTSAELIACAQQVKQLALSNPNIEVSFVNGDKLVFLYQSTNNDWIARVHDVFGEEFRQSCVLVERKWNDMKCFGLVSCPTYRQNDGQYIFVNKRFIKDRSLAAAIKVSYQDVLIPGENPSYALFITMNANDVDVNVHPAKTEVRFRQPGNVRSLLISAIRDALSTTQNTSALLSNKIISYVSSENSDMQQNKFTVYQCTDRSSNLSVVADDTVALNYTNIKEKYSETNEQSKLYPIAKRIGGTYIEPAFTEHKNDTRTDFLRTNVVSGLDHQHNQESDSEHQNVFLGEAKAQIFDSFIISQNEDSMFLIDQHAAHERIVYEQLRKDLAISKDGIIVWCGLCQKLMFSIKITLNDEDQLAIAEILLYLQKIGFSCKYNEEEMSIEVFAVPKICEATDIAAFVKDLISEQHGIIGQSALLENVHKIFATHACHNSVRANHVLSFAEMNALLRQIETTKRSGQCNHGRPTYVKLSRKNIEALFERIG